jgi:hypothetical protein
MTQYIVKADEPFPGYIQSTVLDDGTVAYTDGMTPEDYSKDRGYAIRLIDAAELTRLFNEHEAGLITDPSPITEDDWHDALNCLPPSRWGHSRGVELFHISERITGDLVDWFAQVGGQYFRFVDLCNRDPAELAAKVAAKI